MVEREAGMAFFAVGFYLDWPEMLVVALTVAILCRTLVALRRK